MATIKDKIGLAMIPSVYDGGISTSETDFSGTVHSLLPIQHTGPNLVANGVFDQDGDWTKGTGWSISEGKAIHTGGTASYLSQDILEANKTYKVKIKVISADASNFVQIYMGNSPASELLNSSGEYTFTLKAQSNTILGFAIRGVGEAEIDNVSVQLISNGDFDFERSSAATRVGPDGYIKDVQVIGEELVQNGRFEDIGNELAPVEDYDANFSSSPSSGTVTEENGVVTAVGATSVGAFVQLDNRNITVGKVYKVSFSLSNVTGGNFKLSIGNQYTAQQTEDGDYVFYIKYTSGLDRFYFAFGDFTGTVSNISVKEVGQNWTFGSGWSIEDDGGNLRAVQSGGSTSSVYQNILTVGKLYKASFEIKSITSGQFKIGIGENYSELYDEEGTYTYTAIATTDGLARIRPQTTTTIGTVDNFTVKEITDDTDIPRLDYSDGAQPALLLEPERSNLLPYSKDFSSNWVSNGSTLVTDNVSGIISPDGSQSASLIEKNSQPYSRVEYIKNVDTTGYYTFSVFAKKANIDSWIKLRIDANGVGECTFNLSNGEIGTSGTLPYDYGVEIYKNNWYRFYIVQNITDVSSNEYFRIYIMDSESGEGNTNDAEGYIWGAQVEQGIYPTSYIPNNGETNGVTRNADVCNNAGDSTIFNDAEGVLYFEAKVLDVSTGAGSRVISISDGSDSNTVRIDLNNNQFRFQVIDGGSFTVSNNVNRNDDLSYNKIAARYKENDCAFYVNGVNIAADTSATMPSGLSVLNFARAQQTSGRFCGNVRSVLYFNEALTDAELEKLTSSNATQVLNNYSTLLTRVGATYESSGLETKLNELL